MKRFAERVMISTAVLALVAQAHAALPMLTHSVDGMLFNETFENQTVTGVQATGAPTTANITPGAPGNQWFTVVNGATSLLNRDAASDASLDAYEGSKYVRVNRPDNNSVILIGDFGATDYGSGTLTMSFAAYVEGPINTGKGYVFRFDRLDNGAVLSSLADVGMQINVNPSGAIQYLPPSLTATNTGLNWTPNQWQRYVIAYNLDADTFSLSVDGNTVSGLAATNNLSDISRFSWQAFNFNSGSFYIDAMPEPATLGVILGIALLSAGRRRR